MAIFYSPLKKKETFKKMVVVHKGEGSPKRTVLQRVWLYGAEESRGCLIANRGSNIQVV